MKKIIKRYMTERNAENFGDMKNIKKKVMFMKAGVR